MDGEQAGGCAGRSARALPDMEFLLGGTEIGVDGKERDVFAASSERRLDEKVEQSGVIASRPPRHEEAAAARRSERRLGDEGHECTGERGVERVAAVFEDFRGGRDGQLMPRRDHAFGLCHWPGLGGVAGRGKSRMRAAAPPIEAMHVALFRSPLGESRAPRFAAR